MDHKSLITGCTILLLVVSTVTLGFGYVESSPEKINEAVESERGLSIDRSGEKERSQEDEIDFETHDRWPKKQEEKGQLDGKEDVLELNSREKIEHQLDEDNYTTRDPININGNEEFHEKAEENNWSGEGTEKNPYIIEGYEIDGSKPTYAIIIGHTDVHFVIRNNYLYNAWFPEPYWYTGAVTLVNITNGMVNNNTIRFSSFGVNLMSLSYNQVLNNTLIGNDQGIRVSNSHSNRLSGNYITIKDGSPVIHHSGIHLKSSENNRITENNISNYSRTGARAIFADGGSKNIIYHNILIDNEVHAEDHGDNIWNKPYPIGGNYWDNHTGPDEYKGPHQDVPGSDGIVDEPKDIGDGDNIDKYPLAAPTPPSLDEFELEIESTEGGSVVEPGEGTFTCYTVELVAEADEDCIFDSWTGDVAGIEDPESPETRITIWDNSTITANFRELEDFDLNIDVEGEGTVKVDSEEVDQDFQKTYQEGTSINLTAIPDEGSYFDRWKGDYTGLENEIKIEMDEDKEITGVFEEVKKIYDWYDLDVVREDLNAGYVLMNDLDENTDGYGELVERERGWEPIGEKDEDGNLSFRGIFDGNRNEIKDLFINRTEENYIGLFGYIEEGSEIKNLRASDAEVVGNYSTGGLFGENDNGIIKNVYFEGEVSGNSRIGGLVGQNTGVVKNSYTSGKVSGEINIGGLIGVNDGLVSNAYSTTEITGENWRSAWIGGLVGYNTRTVKNSYVAGYVSGAFGTGGLVGRPDGNVSNSFWDIEATGQDPNGDSGTGKTTAEMKDLTTYTDTSTEGLDEPWDFVRNPYDDEGNEDIWDIDEDEEINNGYPFLVWNHYHTLNMTIEGEGTVEIYPDEDEYRTGSEIDLTAIPDDGWEFVGWTGDVPEGEEGEEITITIDEDKEITAVFEEEEVEETPGFKSVALLLAAVIAVAIYKKKKN